MKQSILVILVLFVLTIPAVKSLLFPGGYTSHDLTHHVLRQISMDKLLGEGQFPPRWSGELNNGYGYPVFLFNYPLPPLLGEVFYKIGLPAGRQGFGYVDSVKAVLFLSVILSVAGMYLFLKSLSEEGSELASIVGTAFYLYAPVRFVNLYVSASVGSALALGILPFVFWGITDLSKGKNKGILVGGIALAALITSHNVTALMFAPVILGFAGLLVWQSKDRLEVIKKMILLFILGLGLSAWFWIPAAFEKQYIRYDELLPRFWADQFPTARQLLYSPWGYGLSHPGDKEDGLSFQIGIPQILVIIITLLVLSFPRMRESNNLSFVQKWIPFFKGMTRDDKTFLLFVLLVFSLSVFMMLEVSSFVWDRLPMIGYIQFPSRFLAVSVFCSAIAVSILVNRLPYKQIIFVGLLVLVLFANRNHLNVNQRFDPGLQYYLSNKGTTSTFGEHLPKWGRLINTPSPGKFEVLEGTGKIRLKEDKSFLVLAEVTSTTSATLRFNQFYFPGWQIEVDGKASNFDYLIPGESYGLIVLEVPLGTHIIKAQFKNTLIRNIADLISAISVIFMLSLIYAIYQRKCPNS